MMPGQKKAIGGGYHERRGGFMRAISLLAFNTRLWICDPLAECRKAGEGRRAAECEISGISWVEHQRMVLEANREGIRTARTNLPPPHLDPQFEVPARFVYHTPAATPASNLPSGGGSGSRVRGCSGGGGGSHSGVGGSRGGWHRGGRQRVRW